MATRTTIELSAGNLRLELSPGTGGAISAFEWTSGELPTPILRKCHTPLENVLEAGCFPLVPYVNRIRGGQFRFRDRVVKLRPNMAGDPSPLHGQGWLNSWEVEDCTARRRDAQLSATRPVNGLGTMRRGNILRSTKGGLTVTLDCRNISAEPMPCGLGQHPYFPCGPKTMLDTEVTNAWTVDENVLPVDKVAAEGRYDLKDRLICGQDLDNGFGRVERARPG